MIHRLPFDMLYSIMKFLPNHEILNYLLIRKNMYKMFKVFNINKVIEFVSYREHPLVFNKNDNYCLFCNQGLIFFLDDKNKDFINCNHS
jgi:hypothetical protein